MAAGSPSFDASLDVSHTQTTSIDQAGAVVVSGINFAPLPAPAAPVSNPGAYGNALTTMPINWDEVGLVAGIATAFLTLVYLIFRRKKS